MAKLPGVSAHSCAFICRGVDRAVQPTTRRERSSSKTSTRSSSTSAWLSWRSNAPSATLGSGASTQVPERAPVVRPSLAGEIPGQTGRRRAGARAGQGDEESGSPRVRAGGVLRMRSRMRSSQRHGQRLTMVARESTWRRAASPQAIRSVGDLPRQATAARVPAVPVSVVMAAPPGRAACRGLAPLWEDAVMPTRRIVVVRPYAPRPARQSQRGPPHRPRAVQDPAGLELLGADPGQGV